VRLSPSAAFGGDDVRVGEVSTDLLEIGQWGLAAAVGQSAKTAFEAT
jgi:hypothetical protein